MSFAGKATNTRPTRIGRVLCSPCRTKSFICGMSRPNLEVAEYLVVRNSSHPKTAPPIKSESLEISTSLPQLVNVLLTTKRCRGRRRIFLTNRSVYRPTLAGGEGLSGITVFSSIEAPSLFAICSIMRAPNGDKRIFIRGENAGSPDSAALHPGYETTWFLCG